MSAPVRKRSAPGRCRSPSSRLTNSLALAALDPVRANLLVQIRALHAERDARLGDIPFERAQRLQNVLPFGRFPERAQRQAFAMMLPWHFDARVRGARIAIFLERACMGVFR